MSDVSQIDGNAVRLQRESQGWALSDLATRACLSVKQVRQIEEGGMTAFYSETVKLTAARKIAALLHMSDKQLFGQTLSTALPVEVEAQEDHLNAPSTTQALGLAQWGGLNNQINPISRSEVLHELAQPPEHMEDDASTQTDAVLLEVDQPEAQAVSVDDQPMAQPDLTPPAQSTAQTSPQLAATEEAPSSASGNYFLKILALFVVALAAAALLKQNAVEEKPSTPAAEAPPAPEQPPVPPPSVVDPAAQPAPAVSEIKPTTEPKLSTTVPNQVATETKPASADAKPAPAPAKPAESNPPSPP